MKFPVILICLILLTASCYKLKEQHVYHVIFFNACTSKAMHKFS